MSTSTPPPGAMPGSVPDYVHEETVYEDGKAPVDEFEDDVGDWERTLTDRIRQLVEQPSRRGQATEEAEPEPETLSTLASGNLDDSTAGVDWTFVQSRDSGASPAPQPGDDPDADTRAGDEDVTPVGQRIVMEALAAGAPERGAPDAGIVRPPPRESAAARAPTRVARIDELPLENPPPTDPKRKSPPPGSLDTRPDTNAKRRRPPGSLDTQPARDANDTRPLDLDPGETQPVPGVQTTARPARRQPLGSTEDTVDDIRDGFGIVRRPKR